MQIVIDISEEKYNQIINRYKGSNVRPKDYEIAIINGTVLPEDYKDGKNEKRETIKADQAPDAISKQAVLDIFGYVMDYWKEHAIDVEPHEIEDALIEQYEFTAKQLNELPPVTPQSKTGQWIRMSDLSEQEDDRYKCSHCGNVIHHKNKMNLYTFNSWCGRCGSDNGRK